jgi:hypothetical protein
MTDRDDQRRPRSSVAMWFVVLLAALPALYVLSVGPVGAWIDNRYPSQQADYLIHSIYAPLGWLSLRCEPFDKALSWYCGLWPRKTGD